MPGLKYRYGNCGGKDRQCPNEPFEVEMWGQSFPQISPFLHFLSPHAVRTCHVQCTSMAHVRSMCLYGWPGGHGHKTPQVFFSQAHVFATASSDRTKIIENEED